MSQNVYNPHSYSGLLLVEHVIEQTDFVWEELPSQEDCPEQVKSTGPIKEEGVHHKRNYP